MKVYYSLTTEKRLAADSSQVKETTRQQFTLGREQTENLFTLSTDYGGANRENHVFLITTCLKIPCSLHFFSTFLSLRVANLWQIPLPFLIRSNFVSSCLNYSKLSNKKRKIKTARTREWKQIGMWWKIAEFFCKSWYSNKKSETFTYY